MSSYRGGIFMNYNKIIKFIIIAVVLTLTFAILLNLSNGSLVHNHRNIMPTIMENE